MTDIIITETIEKVYNREELEAELQGIDSQLASLENEPNEITVPNDSKFFQIEQLNNRKAEINKILES